jgi:hypothetical protein
MRKSLIAGAVAAVGALGLGLPAMAEDPAPAAATAEPAQAAPAAPTAGAPAAPTTATYTEAQLQHFAAASVEIERVQTQARASGGPNEQTQAQIRAALDTHQLDAATYNGIVEAMRADPVLAQRVVAFRTQTGTATN